MKSIVCRCYLEISWWNQCRKIKQETFYILKPTEAYEILIELLKLFIEKYINFDDQPIIKPFKENAECFFNSYNLNMATSRVDAICTKLIKKSYIWIYLVLCLYKLCNYCLSKKHTINIFWIRNIEIYSQIFRSIIVRAVHL